MNNLIEALKQDAVEVQAATLPPFLAPLLQLVADAIALLIAHEGRIATLESELAQARQALTATPSQPATVPGVMVAPDVGAR